LKDKELKWKRKENLVEVEKENLVEVEKENLVASSSLHGNFILILIFFNFIFFVP
jgi:hypothetical protein